MALALACWAAASSTLQLQLPYEVSASTNSSLPLPMAALSCLYKGTGSGRSSGNCLYPHYALCEAVNINPYNILISAIDGWWMSIDCWMTSSEAENVKVTVYDQKKGTHGLFPRHPRRATATVIFC
jgi:hypothetical protein